MGGSGTTALSLGEGRTLGAPKGFWLLASLADGRIKGTGFADAPGEKARFELDCFCQAAKRDFGVFGGLVAAGESGSTGSRETLGEPSAAK